MEVLEAMIFYGSDEDEACLILSYSCRHLVAEAAREAHRLQDAARELDGVTRLAPLPAWIGGDQAENDQWWTAVFGDTERELVEQKSTLARRYNRLPWWKRKDRRSVLRAYVRVDQMLMAGRGLVTTWR